MTKGSGDSFRRFRDDRLRLSSAVAVAVVLWRGGDDGCCAVVLLLLASVAVAPDGPAVVSGVLLVAVADDTARRGSLPLDAVGSSGWLSLGLGVPSRSSVAGLMVLDDAGDVALGAVWTSPLAPTTADRGIGAGMLISGSFVRSTTSHSRVLKASMRMMIVALKNLRMSFLIDIVVTSYISLHDK